MQALLETTAAKQESPATCDHPLGPGSQGALCQLPEGHAGDVHKGYTPPEGRIAESFLADEVSVLDRLIKAVTAAKQGSPEAPEVVYVYPDGSWILEPSDDDSDPNTRYVRGDIAEGREAELAEAIDLAGKREAKLLNLLVRARQEIRVSVEAVPGRGFTREHLLEALDAAVSENT